MKVKFYGTRGVFPVGAQMSCAWVDGPDGSFVIDLGSADLFADPARVASIDHVLLTHMHPDHIAMLASLIIERLNLPDASGDCLFISPESIRDYMEFSDLHDVPGWRQTDGVPAEWCGLKLEAILTNHPKKNFAYKLSDETATVVWTGDCSYSPELAAFCRGADVIICESSMKESSLKKALEWGHMTPSLFAKLMNEAAPATAVATHFMELDPPEFIAEVRKHLDPGIKLIAAYDGLVIDTEPEDYGL
jgi:ribonuclease BN (tRNA processing enzyme)